MARAHIGYDVTVSLDLANWFESVTEAQLGRAGVSMDRSRRCCPGGVVRQGLPTSPAAANIAGVALDLTLVRTLGLPHREAVYTRYADDLTVSWRYGLWCDDLEHVARVIRQRVELFSWAVNERKTRVQYASAGRRIICGLSVGETDVRATRAVRHRLRACQHARPGTPETRGLAEWAACKLPGSGSSRAHVTRVLSMED
jgi:hypothetical protein